MPVFPTFVKFATLGILSTLWLAIHQRIMQLDAHLVYHLAAMHRDRRKAAFYYRSVWVGLVAAFIGLGCQEAMSQVAFDSSVVRDTMLGAIRGLGLWGLLIVGMVWVRIGLRASQPNLDGDSLAPFGEEERNKKRPGDTENDGQQ
jgi:hypothetical protein